MTKKKTSSKKDAKKSDKAPAKKADVKPEKKPEAEKPGKDEFSKGDYYFIGTVVVILLIFAGVVYYVNTQPEPQPEIVTKTYNGFTFTQVGQFWTTNMQVQDTFQGTTRDFEIAFHFTPDEVEDIPTMQNSRNESISPNLFLSAQRVYITTDPDKPAEMVLGAVEIAKIIGRIYEKEVKSALTSSVEGSDAPIITCEDIGPGVRVIYLLLGNKTEVYSDNGCIVIEGSTPTEVVKASERLAYEMLKIL